MYYSLRRKTSRLCAAALAVLVLFSAVLCGCSEDDRNVLVLLASEEDVSFESLKKTAEDWGTEKGIAVTVAAAPRNSASGQLELAEKEIRTKQWDLIVADPLGDEDLYPILEYAGDEGSVIVTLQGSPELKADYTIQPCKYEDLGYSMMEAAADIMGDTGSYVTIVPSRKAKTALREEMACISQQKQNYPQMVLLSRQQQAGGYSKAYETAETLYTAYGMDGILFYSHSDGLGIAKWKTESGNEDVVLIGLGHPDYMQDALDSGAIDVLFYWDQENILQACLEVGYQAINGRIEDDADVITTGIDGYRTLRSLGGGVYYGNDISTVNLTQ